MRLAQVWSLLPVAFAFCFAASVPIKHSDLFYTLLNGQLMVELGVFPVTSDPFTYAPAAPGFFNQPWIAQLLFLAAERLGGWAGVSFVHAAALASAFALEGWLARREGARSSQAAGLTLLALALAATSFNIRPQSFAPLLFVSSLALVRRTRARQWWAVPALLLVSAVWANVHGSFVLGVLLAGVHLAGAAVETRDPGHPSVRHLAWLTLAAAVGTLLNPGGPLVWRYALRVAGDPTVRQHIAEWQPSSLDSLTGQLFLGTLPLVLVALLWRRSRPRPGDVLLLLAVGGLALATQRAVPWWGLILPPVLARHLAGRGDRSDPARRELPALNAALLAALAGVMTLSLPWFRPLNPLLAPELRTYLSADHPTGAAAYLARTGARGTLFARMEWGGYLAWCLWPRMRVFLDARIENHPPEVWRDYFAILDARQGWDTLLDAYGADYLLLERAAFGELVRVVDAHPGWRRVYFDDLSVLYARAREDPRWEPWRASFHRAAPSACTLLLPATEPRCATSEL